MRRIKAAFVGFGESNTPREIITKKCFDAKYWWKTETSNLFLQIL
jgi:hypothetical protein